MLAEENQKEVELVFLPSAKVANLTTENITSEAKTNKIKPRQLVKYFKDFKVDAIKLTAETILESDKTLYIVISLGKGGLEIDLKPVEKTTKPTKTIVEVKSKTETSTREADETGKPPITDDTEVQQ